MNRRFVTAFAIVCIVAAFAAAASVVYRVLAADGAGRKAALADFEGLKSVLAGIGRASDLADPGLRARLASRYEANPGLLLVDVYERGSGDRWRIPAYSPYLPSLGTGGSLPQPVYPPTSTMLLSSPLKGDSSGSLAVDALYTNLTQVSVFDAFRDAFIALASFLALAALTLAAIMGRDGLRAGSVLAAGAETGARGPKAARAPERAASAELAAAAAEYQYETLAEEAAEKAQAASRGIAVKIDSSSVEGEDPDLPVLAEKAADSPPSDACDECGPTGLYSPASGLGWESYMKDRLGAELSRSASFEQDLSLLEIRYEGLGPQDPNYSVIGDAIGIFFSFKDLCFERGEDGFSAILPNLDSDHALRMAQEFYKKLAFLAGGRFAELEQLPLFMGISSRGGRLIDAHRMIEEADAALEKASGERHSRIVAFKPDPDKYRSFLASNSKGA
jgi:hypothetical protein